MSNLESWLTSGLFLLCLALLVLPPKWDPAIRLKEWLEKKDRK